MNRPHPRIDRDIVYVCVLMNAAGVSFVVGLLLVSLVPGLSWQRIAVFVAVGVIWLTLTSLLARHPIAAPLLRAHGEPPLASRAAELLPFTVIETRGLAGAVGVGTISGVAVHVAGIEDPGRAVAYALLLAIAAMVGIMVEAPRTKGTNPK